MADPSPNPSAGEGPDGQLPPRMPRWVKALAIGALIVIAAVVIVMLLAGGDHGPGRHAADSANTSSIEALWAEEDVEGERS